MNIAEGWSAKDRLAVAVPKLGCSLADAKDLFAVAVKL